MPMIYVFLSWLYLVNLRSHIHFGFLCSGFEDLRLTEKPFYSKRSVVNVMNECHVLRLIHFHLLDKNTFLTNRNIGADSTQLSSPILSPPLLEL